MAEGAGLIGHAAMLRWRRAGRFTNFMISVQRPNRIPCLDGLRALSVLFVLCEHLSHTRHFLTPSLVHVVEDGDFADLGVRSFFVISGFLITTLLLGEQEKYGSISLKRFYLRRTFRILPPCYVYIAVVGLCMLAGLLTLPLHDFVFAVTYTMNYNIHQGWQLGHLWSLGVEEQFYFLWPAVVAFAGSKRAMKIAVGVMCLAPFIRLAGFYFHWHPPGQYMVKPFETCCDGLAAGCLLAGTRGWLAEQSWYKAFLTSRWPYLLPLAILLCNESFQRPRISFMVGIPAENILIALLIDWVVRMPGTRAGRFLENPYLARLGVLSYSIYLWQQLFCTQTRFGDTWWGQFPVNVLSAVVCGWLSYTIVEQPALRLRDRVEARWLGVRTRVAPQRA